MLRGPAVVIVVALATALGGCAAPEGEDAPPATTTVEPPQGTAWATCPPTDSLPLPLALRADAASDRLAQGLHRLDARTFLWVWRNYTEDLHEDKLTRINPVEAARDAAGTLHLCTRADVSSPTTVDTEPRTYAVGLRITALEDLPAGPVRVTVNWVAGCPCETLPRGNDTRLFDG